MPYWGELPPSDERVPVPIILIPAKFREVSPQKETIISTRSPHTSSFPTVSCRFMRKQLRFPKKEKDEEEDEENAVPNLSKESSLDQYFQRFSRDEISRDEKKNDTEEKSELEEIVQESLYLDEKSSDDALFYSIKLLARAQGFEEVHKDAVDLLVDLTKLFLNNFGESAKRIREKIARRRKSPLGKEDFMTILDKTVEKIGIVPEKGKGVEGLYDWYREEVVAGQEEESEKPGSPIFRDESAMWDEIHAEHSIHRIHLEGSPMRKSKKQKIEKKGSVEVEDEFSAELASPLVGDLGQGDSLGAIVNAALVSVESDDCRRVDSLLCAYNEDSSDCLPPPAPF